MLRLMPKSYATMWYGASASPQSYRSGVETTDARSSPSIGGQASSASSASRVGCVPRATTPRMTPALRRCRVSRRVSTPSRSGHAGALEPGQKIAVRAPVGVAARQLAHDDAGDLRLRGLGIVRVDAIVADHRRGHHHDLPAVRRIGEDLLVAAHVRREHDLGDRRCLTARRGQLARKKGSVFEKKEPWSVARRAVHDTIRVSLEPASVASVPVSWSCSDSSSSASRRPVLRGPRQSAPDSPVSDQEPGSLRQRGR